MDLDLRVLKEPRGFIRILQFVMSIFAFATTAGFQTVAEFSRTCPEKSPVNIKYKFGYPFKLADYKIRSTERCDPSEVTEDSLPFNLSSSAQFFVATGVLAFLYTIAITAVYVVLHQKYNGNHLFPVGDLAATGVLSLFWLAGSSAWAQGVSDVRYYTNPANFIKNLHLCLSPQGVTCDSVSEGKFATLNVSLIFGFANFCLWASSMWFVYKETFFHKGQEQQQQQFQQQPKQSPPMHSFSPPQQSIDIPNAGSNY